MSMNYNLSSRFSIRRMICGVFFAAAVAVFSPLQAGAKNLLENAIPQDAVLQSVDAVKANWNVLRSDGATDNRYLNSCYSKVQTSGGVRDLANESYDLNYDDFKDRVVLLLEYPSDSNDKKNWIYYSIPIKVEKEGDYTLSGDVRRLKSFDNTAYMPNDKLMPPKILVMTAEKEAGKKNIEIVNKDGKNVIEVRDLSGNELANVYKPETADNPKFEGTIHLTPSDKYLSFYSSPALIAIANLNLDNPGENTGMVDIISSDGDSEAEAVYYDLQGRKVNEPVTTGVYICRKGTKVEKIIVK